MTLVLARYFHPPLSTVAATYRGGGRGALSAVPGACGAKRPPHPHLFETSLVVRHSSLILV